MKEFKEVMKALESLYEIWAKNGNTSEALDSLMMAYDKWLG